jgi:hypothetical protein
MFPLPGKLVILICKARRSLQLKNSLFWECLSNKIPMSQELSFLAMCLQNPTLDGSLIDSKYTGLRIEPGFQLQSPLFQLGDFGQILYFPWTLVFSSMKCDLFLSQGHLGRLTQKVWKHCVHTFDKE